jgi:hypothetical protein
MIAEYWRIWSPNSWRSNRRPAGRFYRFLRKWLGPRFRAARRAYGALFRLTVRDDRRCIASSGLFDARWYLEHYPEAAASDLDPLDHYLAIGWKNGLSPGPRFDAARYLEQSRDAALADCEPLLHFIRHGVYEGRKAYEVGGSILDRFESLGDGCEFGLAQRALGSEPLGLCRFAGTSLDGLIAAFGSRLDVMRSPAQLNAAVALSHPRDGDCIVSIPGYGLSYHTFIGKDDANIAQLAAFETRRIALLSRKLLEDLEDANKIFVYKSNPPAPRAKIDGLVACLRSFGPNCLLWVTTAAPGRPAGFVERLDDGLLRGYIDRFALDENSFDISVTAWETLCRNAHGLWLAGRADLQAS